MRKLQPVSPGELLKEEFLEPMGISQYRLAKEIEVPIILLKISILIVLIFSFISKKGEK